MLDQRTSNDELDQASFSFIIEDPHGMLEKLKREIERMVDASFRREDLIDHGMNCALTAWHIVDWVWNCRLRNDMAALNELLRRHADLKDELLRSKSRSRQDIFKEYVTRECPELALCQDIANGIKHVRISRPAKRASPPAEGIAVSEDVAPPGPFKLDESALGAAGLGGPGYEAGGKTCRLMIQTTTTGRRDAIEVFDRALAFWKRLLAKAPYVA